MSNVTEKIRSIKKMAEIGMEHVLIPQAEIEDVIKELNKSPYLLAKWHTGVETKDVNGIHYQSNYLQVGKLRVASYRG